MEGLRRIVTGHNADGKSILMIDGPPGSISDEIGGVFGIWSTDGNQINTFDEIDRADLVLSLPKGGTKFWYVVVNPTPEGVPKEKLEELVAAGFAKIGVNRVDTTRHPAMHKTKTIDYVILLKGDVTLLLDDDEVQLKPFDVVVQRGTNHAWVNNGKEPALLAAVLIDSDLKD